MAIQRQISLNGYTTLNMKPTSETVKFPLILKNAGFVNDKRLVFGTDMDIDDILILYSLSGIAEFFKNRDLKYMNAHEIILSACNHPMKFRGVSSKGWECLYVVVAGRYAKYFYNLIRTNSGILRVDPLCPIIDCFCDIIKCGDAGTVRNCMRISTLLNILFMELYEISFRINTYKSTLPVRDSYVNIALRYITEHFTTDISVDDVCANVGFSKYYFCKVFKKNTGISIHKYINECRINRAKELLSYSKLSISSIAVELGYKSSLTFLRNFQKSTEMTPSEYRRNF